ncbi:MAG: ABC transporter permease [Anaerolineae bacterium]
MPYLALVRMSLQRELSYRTANVAGMVTNVFFGVLRASVLIALFGARDNVAGYSVRDAVTYTGITQALLSYVSVFGWWEVMRSVRSGEIATDLSRPMDYFAYWFARDAGRAFAQITLRGLSILALYAIVYRITLPPTPVHAVATIVSLLLALVVSFAFRFLVNLAAFWSPDATGIGRLCWTANSALSGMIVPLALLPPVLAQATRLMPFAAMINTPTEVYLGIVSGPHLVAALALQAFWATALVLGCRVVLAAGVRRLVVQGG